MNKKVLFVATVAGHIRAFHIPYLKLFKDNGYEVHVATAGEFENEYCDNFHEICIKRSPFDFDNLKAIKQLRAIIEKEKFDIIHCHTPMGGVVARLAAKNARKHFRTRVIYTSHGFHFYKGSSMISWLLYYPMEWYLAKYTDTIITINKEDFELVKNKFLKRCSNVFYVPGVGVNPNKFDIQLTNDERNRIRNSIGLNHDDFVIIYPARLCKDKNQILLLNFMKRINIDNVKLVLPGSDEYDGYLQSYVKQNDIKNVIFLGNRSDIPQLLRTSDLLIASSLREGFGINLIEALVSSIPVIAVENRGHNEILQNGINGYLIKNDVLDLVNKFETLYYDHDTYSRIRANSYESITKFMIDNCIQIMKGIYFNEE